MTELPLVNLFEASRVKLSAETISHHIHPELFHGYKMLLLAAKAERTLHKIGFYRNTRLILLYYPRNGILL